MAPTECPHCWAPLLPAAKACARCGRALEGPPPREAATRETRASALTAKIVAGLLVLYMLGVVGYFVYDNLL